MYRLCIWKDLGSNSGSSYVTLPKLITLSKCHFSYLIGFVRINWECRKALITVSGTVCLCTYLFPAAYLKHLCILPSRMWGQACSNSGHILFFKIKTVSSCLRCLPCLCLYSWHYDLVTHPFPLIFHITIELISLCTFSLYMLNSCARLWAEEYRPYLFILVSTSAQCLII